jgi:ketosteroid isomerase-like protein
LENIRQANLKKDINLLMSCYASDYKDLEERRRTALQSWSRYNYLDLDYVLKVESVSIDSAKARVEWQIRSIPVTGGQPEEGKSVLNVIFQKEKNEWKIKKVTPVK